MSRIQVDGFYFDNEPDDKIEVPIGLLDVNSIKFGNPNRYSYRGNEYTLYIVYGYTDPKVILDKLVGKVTKYRINIPCLKENDDKVLSKHLKLDEYIMKRLCEIRKKNEVSASSTE